MLNRMSYGEEVARIQRLLQTNQGSWAWVMEFVGDMPLHNPNWIPYTEFLMPLLKACVDAGFDEYFRAGQSMSHVIFSTAEKHRLEQYAPSPLRVTIKSDKLEGNQPRWCVARSYGNLWSSAPDRETPIECESAFPVLKQYLEDLWRETRPAEPLPPPFLSR